MRRRRPPPSHVLRRARPPVRRVRQAHRRHRRRRGPTAARAARAWRAERGAGPALAGGDRAPGGRAARRGRRRRALPPHGHRGLPTGGRADGARRRRGRRHRHDRLRGARRRRAGRRGARDDQPGRVRLRSGRGLRGPPVRRRRPTVGGRPGADDRAVPWRVPRVARGPDGPREGHGLSGAGPAVPVPGGAPHPPGRRVGPRRPERRARVRARGVPLRRREPARPLGNGALPRLSPPGAGALAHRRRRDRPLAEPPPVRRGGPALRPRPPHRGRRARPQRPCRRPRPGSGPRGRAGRRLPHHPAREGRQRPQRPLAGATSSLAIGESISDTLLAAITGSRLAAGGAAARRD